MTHTDIKQHRHIPASAVREFCGGISDMTLWRWQRDAALGFPRPIRIAKRRFWRERDILDWLESRRETAA